MASWAKGAFAPVVAAPSKVIETFAQQYAADGYACVPKLLPDQQLAALGTQLAVLPEAEAVRRKDSIYGVRNLLDQCPEVSDLALSPEIWPFVTAVLGPQARAVRAIFFNKTADANWSLRWHQDSVIAVAEKREAPRLQRLGREGGRLASTSAGLCTRRHARHSHPPRSLWA